MGTKSGRLISVLSALNLSYLNIKLFPAREIEMSPYILTISIPIITEIKGRVAIFNYLPQSTTIFISLNQQSNSEFNGGSLMVLKCRTKQLQELSSSPDSTDTINNRNKSKSVWPSAVLMRTEL